MAVHVAVTIVSYNSAEDVADCLQALAASCHDDFEVVICENGGARAFHSLRSLLPQSLPAGQPVRLICAERNLGYAGGVNRAMAAAPDADAWWVLNPDTRPEPDALGALVARLGRGDCEAVGGVILMASGKVQSYGGYWQKRLARAVSLGYGAPMSAKVDGDRIEQRQNYLNGACMLVGRAFVTAAGPMREDYFLYCEEVEWCLRAIQAGMRLGFAGDALVLHKQGTSTGAHADLRTRSKLSVYLNERNRVLVSRDLFPQFLPLALFTVLATLILRFGKRRAWRQLGYAVQGWWAGGRNERGVPKWLPPSPSAG
jgi:N-acetylglucosaminyl-diphospho-decaprenol L-rhamnosyltransferase